MPLPAWVRNSARYVWNRKGGIAKSAALVTAIYVVDIGARTSIDSWNRYTAPVPAEFPTDNYFRVEKFTPVGSKRAILELVDVNDRLAVSGIKPPITKEGLISSGYVSEADFAGADFDKVQRDLRLTGSGGSLNAQEIELELRVLRYLHDGAPRGRLTVETDGDNLDRFKPPTDPSAKPTLVRSPSYVRVHRNNVDAEEGRVWRIPAEGLETTQ